MRLRVARSRLVVMASVLGLASYWLRKDGWVFETQTQSTVKQNQNKCEITFEIHWKPLYLPISMEVVGKPTRQLRIRRTDMDYLLRPLPNPAMVHLYRENTHAMAHSLLLSNCRASLRITRIEIAACWRPVQTEWLFNEAQARVSVNANFPRAGLIESIQHGAFS